MNVFLKRIDITNSGDNYFDIPLVTFTVVCLLQGTAGELVYREVTKVLVEDGEFIDLADAVINENLAVT